MNLIDKYKPKKSNFITGQYFGVKNLKDWLSNWNPKQKFKAALINGQVCQLGFEAMMHCPTCQRCAWDY